ncbi:MAG TPA: hypothetical protein P5560_04060 [Thermotogota bacterium]|nr:hypothetical protein [Thermotogota bacterium]HRW92106.1 hypothetical protein [Thermotogota bacterium]
MAPTSRVRHVRFPLDLDEKVEKAALSTGLPAAFLVRNAVSRYLMELSELSPEAKKTFLAPTKDEARLGDEQLLGLFRASPQMYMVLSFSKGGLASPIVECNPVTREVLGVSKGYSAPLFWSEFDTRFTQNEPQVMAELEAKGSCRFRTVLRGMGGLLVPVEVLASCTQEQKDSWILLSIRELLPVKG